REGPDRWFHGSVAEAVVHGSTVPVMLVRADQTPNPEALEWDEPALIVPLDGSQLAENALPFAAQLAQHIGARIMLVGVVPKEGQLVARQGGAILTYTGVDHTSLATEAR